MLDKNIQPGNQRLYFTARKDTQEELRAIKDHHDEIVWDPLAANCEITKLEVVSIENLHNNYYDQGAIYYVRELD
jgi:hypothetical protein